MPPGRLLIRKLRAGWRDTILLLREFKRPLFWFVFTTSGSGILYWYLARQAGHPIGGLPHAIYHILTLIFLQSSEPFPDEWFLEVFYFVMPVIGVGILAQGLADFGSLLFNRRARGKEWEMAVASTYNNHVVLVGLGHLGYRVVKKLRELNQEVVVIESKPEPDLLASVQSMDVPVIQDDGAREMAQRSAGVTKARTIILCTQNDSLNLRMAMKARSLAPNIEVIIRIFDDDFAASLHNQFGFHAMSATGMAAPLFATIAAHIDITPPILIEGQPHILANLPISQRSPLCGKSILSVEEKYRVSIVVLCNNGQRQFHPIGQETIAAGNTIAVLGDPERINFLVHENQR